MLNRAVTIGVDVLARMLRERNLGELPAPLQPSPVWRDAEDERRADRAMWAAFDELRLLDGRGRLDEDVADTLRALARPDVEYVAVFALRRRRWAVFLAGGPGETVLARREGDAVRLVSLVAAELPETVVRDLPARPPARVESVTVRLELLAAVNGDEPGGTPAAVRDAHTLLRLGRQRLLGWGELSVGVRDRHNRHRVSTDLVRYHDLPAGRMMLTLAAGHLSVAPATAGRLIDRLRQVRADLG